MRTKGEGEDEWKRPGRSGCIFGGIFNIHKAVTAFEVFGKFLRATVIAAPFT